MTTQFENQNLAETEVGFAKKWWLNRYLGISALFSFFWILFILNYLTDSAWWQNRLDLSPAELVGGLGGLALPMIVVWLVCAYFDRTDKLAEESKVLRAYLNELVYPTPEGAVYTKTLTEALRAQIQEFKAISIELNKQTETVRGDLKKWVQDLGLIIRHVDTKTVGSARQIAEHIKTLAEMTAAANQQADKSSTLFSEQASILARVTEGTVQTTSGLAQTLENNATQMRLLMQEINDVNGRIAQSVQQSDGVMTSLAQNSSKIEDSIKLYEASARQQNARLFGNLEKVLSVFRAHGDLLEQEVNRTASRLTAVENTLKEQVSSLFRMADNAIQKTDDANIALGTTREELAQSLQQFRSEAETVAKQIERASRVMVSAPVVQTVRTDDLLKEASTILTQLQDLSVDMAHLFSPKSEEALWERYYGGDKTVFMRHIRSELSVSQQKKMKELYQLNVHFKSAVDRYMAAFESMTQMMDKGDESKLLMSVLVGSDVGRLYMVLMNMLKGN